MSDHKWTFEEKLKQDGQLIYTNVGDSMMPLLCQGKDLVVISRKPEGRLKKYDVPLYKRDSGQYVLHRILKVRKNDYVLCGDNQWKKEYGITDHHIIGVLTAVIKEDKTISVTDDEYIHYVHKCCDHFFIRASVLFLKSLPLRVRRKLKSCK